LCATPPNQSKNTSMSSSSDQTAPKSRGKNALKNLALAFFTFFVCLTLAELALRIAGYGNVEIYEADPIVYWRLKPNQNCYTKIDHKPVHINDHGTRGPDFIVPKPPNTIRILSLGDSRTFGWGLSDNETYSALLQDRLQKTLGDSRKIEVINAGVNAWSFPQMNAFFHDRALSWQLDMVILADANLWTQFSEHADPAFVKQMMSRVRLKNFLRRFALYHYVVEVKLKELYERERTRFIPVDPNRDTLFKEQQQKDPDAVFRNAIEELCSTAQTNRVQPVLVYIPIQTTLLEPTSNDFTNVLRAKVAVSEKLKVPLLDLTPDLAPKAKELFLEGDPVHPNVAGNEIIGRRLTEVVNSVLPHE
jgi:lysophospholipase L1-like esterase